MMCPFSKIMEDKIIKSTKGKTARVKMSLLTANAMAHDYDLSIRPSRSRKSQNSPLILLSPIADRAIVLNDGETGVDIVDAFGTRGKALPYAAIIVRDDLAAPRCKPSKA